MRDHSACEEAIFAAMAAGKPGKAEYLAARCDLKHGPEPEHVAAIRAELKEEESNG